MDQYRTFEAKYAHSVFDVSRFTILHNCQSMLFLITIFKLGLVGNTVIKDKLYLFFFHINAEIPKILKVTIAMIVSDIIDLAILFF